MADRRLPWGREVARMKAERMAREPIREERLKTKFGERCTVALSAWRGLSGRRYVVGVYTLDTAAQLPSPTGSVILGVRRTVEGHALIVGAGHRGTVADAVALCRPDGATEIHLHNLADTDAEREAIVEDLVGDDAI